MAPSVTAKKSQQYWCQASHRDDNDCDEVENDDFGADVVASICAGVEERGWDAKQLLHALLDCGKTSLFDVNGDANGGDKTTMTSTSRENGAGNQ